MAENCHHVLVGWVGLVGWLGCGVVLVVLFVRLGGDRLGGLIWGIYIITLYYK